MVSESDGGGAIPLSKGGNEFPAPVCCATGAGGNPVLSKDGNGLLETPGEDGNELSAKGGKLLSAGPGGGAIVLSIGGSAFASGDIPGEAAKGAEGNPVVLSSGGSVDESPGNPGAAARGAGGKAALLSIGGNPFESPGKADGKEEVVEGGISPDAGKAGKLLSAIGGAAFKSTGNPGPPAKGAGEADGNAD